MSMSVAGTVATMHLDFDSPEDFNGMKIEMTKNGYFKLTFNYRSGGIDGKVIVLIPVTAVSIRAAVPVVYMKLRLMRR